MPNLETPLSGLPAPYVNEEGTRVLDTRVKDVDGLRSLYVRLRDADLVSNAEMAKHQAMFDGERPFPQAQRVATGQAYLSNFNPNDCKALLDTSLAAYTDLISADETLIEIYTNYGDKTQRDEWSQIMSKNMSRSIRSWPRFFFQYAFIPHYFTLHGVGIAYHEDCYNWQWAVSNLALMKIPRETRACEDDIPYAFARDKATPQSLLKYINNEQYAKDEGWNIPALKKALLKVTTSSMDGYLNWTELEARWKNNDLVWSEQCPSVKIIYGWVKENNGKISIYIFTEDQLKTNGEPEEFLCVKRFAYNNAQEAFTFFTRGIGTNGTYHSIRGLAADIYNAMQALMRLENRKMDIAFESGPMWQVASEEQIETATLTPWGAGMLISQGVAPLSMTMPLLNNTIEPAVNSLRNTIQQNSGTYTSANALQGQREMTKAETLARLEQTANLSVTSINLFNQPMDRLAREIARRFTRKGYMRSDPGGQYVRDWVKDCIEEGVPEEALHNINHRRTRAARVIGFGSPAARRVALQLMMELYPMMDDVGQARLLNKVAGATVGFEEANIYFPPGEKRETYDAQIAELQNNELVRGGECEVSPSENKRVHLDVHIAKMKEFIGAFSEAGENPEMYAEIVPPLGSLYNHAAMTLEVYTGNDAGQYRQALQQVGEILVNGTRHLQKQQEAEAEAMAQMPPEEGMQGVSPEQQKAEHEDYTKNLELQRSVIEFQTRMRIMEEESQAKIARDAADAAAKRARDDVDAAAKLLRETASVQARAATKSSIV